MGRELVLTELQLLFWLHESNYGRLLLSSTWTWLCEAPGIFCCASVCLILRLSDQRFCTFHSVRKQRSKINNLALPLLSKLPSLCECMCEFVCVPDCPFVFEECQESQVLLMSIKQITSCCFSSKSLSGNFCCAVQGEHRHQQEHKQRGRSGLFDGRNQWEAAVCQLYLQHFSPSN